MQERKRSHFRVIPKGDVRVPADYAIDPHILLPVSKEQQDLEHEFLERFLKLADIALSAPPKSRRKKIA